MIFTITVPPSLVSPNSNRKREHVISCITAKGVHQEKIELGRYSRRCTFRKYKYNYIVNSVASIINKGRTLIWIDWNHTKHRFMLPRGWKWGKDTNGIKLYKVGTLIDLHVNAQILSQSISSLIHSALENYRRI